MLFLILDVSEIPSVPTLATGPYVLSIDNPVVHAIELILDHSSHTFHTTPISL